MPRRLARSVCLLGATTLGLAGVALAAEAIPVPVAEKTLTADIAFLEKGLEKEPQKREIATLKAVAMLTALNAQNGIGSGTNASGIRDQALKVADAIAKRDYAGARAAAAEIKQANREAADPVDLATLNKFDLAEVMSCFRGSNVGGLNIEREVKLYAKKIADVEQAAVMGARLALIAEYTRVLPPAEAQGAKRPEWERLSDEMGKLGTEVAAEAAKGDKADLGVLTKKFTALNANCNACHNIYRQ